MSTVKVKNNEPELNDAVTGLVEHLQDNPQDAKASFSVESTLKEGFKSTINARDFEFYIDEPEDFGGANSAPNPIEYLLGSLAACQEITIKTHAQLLGININAVQVKAEGQLDLYGFLAIGDKRPGFERIEYQTIIDTNEENQEKLNALKEHIGKNCPVLDIIQNTVQTDSRVHFTD